ncbi:hypothetical protein Goshw_001088 [Gossypium schwendimanii]|uniref:Uncharacterized protein n=1 Tax=Gossypium schwendimanii TaxID=34291 RepID=A0A7J9L756_GOSSC|nr:hypothetical protein [Gossypium schwendimanii]
MKILRIIASSMRILGPHAMFYLAATVSDFYVPWKSMELVPLKKQPAIAKYGSLPAKKEKQASNSDSFESSSEEDSSSDEEAPAKNKILVLAKKGSVLAAKTKKADSGSDSFDDDGSVEEEDPAAKTKVAVVKNGSASVNKGKSSSSLDSSDEDSSLDEDEVFDCSIVELSLVFNLSI